MKLTVVGRLAECVLLAYRTPVESVAPLVPAGLELVTRNGWAFWNIVACRLEAMRPAGCPRWMGRDCLQVAYRLYVRASPAGDILEGLLFVRTDVDDRAMCAFGNRLTDFRFHHAALRLSANDASVSVSVSDPLDGTGGAELLVRHGAPSLATDSCFDSVAQARQFLKYQPIALSTDGRGERLWTAEVLRDEAAWQESPVEVLHAHWAFLDRIGQHEAHLEVATRIAPIEYRWRMGASRPLARYDDRIGGRSLA